MVRNPLFSRQATRFQSPVLRQITQEVQAVGGVNLGQGVCNLPTPPEIVEAAFAAARAGENRYTSPRGLPVLREALAAKLRAFNGIEADPEAEIVVTCGATGGFEAVCATLLDPGDNVVVFEPTYPYHVQALKRYGAEILTIALTGPGWSVDWDELERCMRCAPKFVLVNTPGNPSGKVWSAEELQRLLTMCETANAFMVTDEIYEYMVFNDQRHVSAGSLEGGRERVITIGGYSKTYSITGWRIGYAVAPAHVAAALATFCDAVYVCAPAPLQAAVAHGIESFPDSFYLQLKEKYQQKRDRFARGLHELGLQPRIPTGAYYMLAGFQEVFPNISSFEFARLMIEKSGVGAVPSDDFVRDPGGAPWVRFCLANEDEVLEDALGRLRSLVG